MDEIVEHSCQLALINSKLTGGVHAQFHVIEQHLRMRELHVFSSLL